MVGGFGGTLVIVRGDTDVVLRKCLGKRGRVGRILVALWGMFFWKYVEM